MLFKRCLSHPRNRNPNPKLSVAPMLFVVQILHLPFEAEIILTWRRGGIVCCTCCYRIPL